MVCYSCTILCKRLGLNQQCGLNIKHNHLYLHVKKNIVQSETQSRNKFSIFYNLELSESKRSYHCTLYIIKLQKMGKCLLIFRRLILIHIGYGFQKKTTCTTIFRFKYSKCNVYSMTILKDENYISDTLL